MQGSVMSGAVMAVMLLMVGCQAAGVPEEVPLSAQPDLRRDCGGLDQPCCREKILVVAGHVCDDGLRCIHTQDQGPIGDYTCRQP
jgi:hypothetical protein